MSQATERLTLMEAKEHKIMLLTVAARYLDLLFLTLMYALISLLAVMTWQELIESARNGQSEEKEDQQPGTSGKAGREELRTQKQDWSKRTRIDEKETPLGGETKHKKPKKRKQLDI